MVKEKIMEGKVRIFPKHGRYRDNIQVHVARTGAKLSSNFTGRWSRYYRA